MPDPESTPDHFGADAYRATDGSCYRFHLGGVYEFVDGEWFWYASGTSHGDRAYRAFREDRLEPCALPADAPALPEPRQALPVRRNRRTYSVPVSVDHWVRGDGADRTAVVLLYGDGRESAFGDGRFNDLVGCFPTATEADAWMTANAEPRFYGYYRRSLDLVIGEDGDVRALEVVDGEGEDRFTMGVVLRDLAARLEGRREPTQPSHKALG